jgi:hypothetical protein
MLNVVIIVFILLGLTIHRYLTAFWEQGLLPYSLGFLVFANFFALTYLVSFVWMFGMVAGVVVFLLCYLQVVYSAGLWVFSLPGLISRYRATTIPRVNRLVYGNFSLIVMIIAALTVMNFFVSPYKSMWEMRVVPVSLRDM